MSLFIEKETDTDFSFDEGGTCKRSDRLCNRA